MRVGGSDVIRSDVRVIAATNKRLEEEIDAGRFREEGVTFQSLKMWETSKDPRYAEKKARVEQLYAIADREAAPVINTGRNI